MSDKKKQPSSAEFQDLVLDLNFVPAWAKKDAAKVSVDKSIKGGGSGRGPRSDRARQDRRDSQGRGPHKGPRRDDRRSDGRSSQAAPERKEFVERAPVRIDFIPNQENLKKVTQAIRSSKRAYNLTDIAHRFLENPNAYSIKYTLFNPPKENQTELYQNAVSKWVFLEKAACEEHSVEVALGVNFEKIEEQTDAPTGSFNCVGRCRLGQELVGPPNYHAYKENIEKLRKEKYAHISSDEFRRKIESVHDEELIEQWKQSQTTQVMYKLKESNLKYFKKDAEAHARKELVADMVKPVKKAIMPASALKYLSDHRLKRSTELALEREMKSTFSISMALRPAFKHSRFFIFSAGKKDKFVTGIAPKPFGNEVVVEEIGQMLNVLKQNPGCDRHFILGQLGLEGEGIDNDNAEQLKALSPLAWLVERGHVIEFYNGTLAVPKSRKK